MLTKTETVIQFKLENVYGLFISVWTSEIWGKQIAMTILLYTYHYILIFVFSIGCSKYMSCHDINLSRRRGGCLMYSVYINTYGRTYMTFILCLSSHDSDGLDKFLYVICRGWVKKWKMNHGPELLKVTQKLSILYLLGKHYWSHFQDVLSIFKGFAFDSDTFFTFSQNGWSRNTMVIS